MVYTDCEGCGHRFEAADTLAGGLANCPGCGKATPVPGLRDPYFRLLQAAMALGWVLLAAIGWMTLGWIGAIAFGVGAALLIGLIRLAL